MRRGSDCISLMAASLELACALGSPLVDVLALGGALPVEAVGVVDAGGVLAVCLVMAWVANTVPTINAAAARTATTTQRQGVPPLGADFCATGFA